jgi:hypothetical protein
MWPDWLAWLCSACRAASLFAGPQRALDFARLMIALCCDTNIAVDYTTSIDCDADPTLGPTDFHASVDVKEARTTRVAGPHAEFQTSGARRSPARRNLRPQGPPKELLSAG